MKHRRLPAEDHFALLSTDNHAECLDRAEEDPSFGQNLCHLFSPAVQGGALRSEPPFAKEPCNHNVAPVVLSLLK